MKTNTNNSSNEAKSSNKSKPMLCDVLIGCKENSVVAFKEKERNEWFTGIISFIYPPQTKYNNTDEYKLEINLNVPIEPQWYNGEQTVYYLEDILDLIVLENIT